MATHRMSQTRFYRIWKSTRERCTIFTNKDYKNYGGRGIKICSRWMKFENFYADMFPDYCEHLYQFDRDTSIERINNDKGYSLDNCRWATRKEQNNNQRSNRLITFKNQTLNIHQWAEKLRINYRTLYFRLVRGWPVERALTK